LKEKNMKYDDRHGGPFDRGGADYWYHRPRDPHYFVEGTWTSPRVNFNDMTIAEIAAYHAGYSAAEEQGDQKDWG
jgi:hypothetical protein